MAEARERGRVGDREVPARSVSIVTSSRDAGRSWERAVGADDPVRVTAWQTGGSESYNFV